jgi:hypothetical protein
MYASPADLVIDTGCTTPAEAAARILDAAGIRGAALDLRVMFDGCGASLSEPAALEAGLS